MSIHLSQRLQTIADLVPAGARVIDVGTDHAMIPVWLAQTQRAVHVWASDIRPGPLQSASRLIDETDTGDVIETRLTDGLQGFGPEDCDTVIIAGMGGETMAGILSEAPWTKTGILLLLEPQSKQDLLRRWLRDNGYAILQELLVKDTGRIYPILLVKAGVPEPYSDAEYLTGRFHCISEDPLFAEYLDGLIRRTSPAAPYDSHAARVLNELLVMKERLSK